MRVGAVDLGTNSTRLLVAEVEDGTVCETLHRETRITRLGEGVDHGRRLLPLALARVRDCLADYRRTADKLRVERILLVATSAVRDAENGAALLVEIERSYCFETRLLTGEQEAELTQRGVDAPDALVIDLGGGSTELVGPGIRTSLDIGSVRLTERFLHGDPPTRAELDACAAAVREALPPLATMRTIGVAGTFTTLRDLAGDLTLAAVEAQVERLASLPLAERRALNGLHPDRAPVIVAGALIVRELLRALELPLIEVSEHDLLDGAALEAALL